MHRIDFSFVLKYKTRLFAILTSFFFLCFANNLEAQIVTVFDNPDSGVGVHFNDTAVIGNTLYFPYQDSGYRTRLAKCDGNTLTLVTNASPMNHYLAILQICFIFPFHLYGQLIII